MGKRVAVLGGGVAGLTAAQELVERGFEVTVYESTNALGGPEKWPALGGKARSFDAPMTSQVIEQLKNDGAKDIEGKIWDGGSKIGKAQVAAAEAALRAKGLVYPSEHGFHYFPGFYRHVTDTLSRIPTEEVAFRTRTVADNLVSGTRVLIARQDPPTELSFRRSLQTTSDVWSLAKAFADLGLPPQEVALVLAKIVELWSASESVWTDKLEKTTWWNFIEAENKSAAYKTYFAEIGVRSTVAMDPKRASARSIGRIVLRLISDLVLHSQGQGPAPDRWLNGPTNEAWIKPWVEYLESKHVVFELRHKVFAIECERERVRKVVFEGGEEVRFRRPGEENGQDGQFDYCLATLPLRAFTSILSRKESASLWSSAPSLRRLKDLLTHNEWMLGMQFYLDRDVPLSPGGMFLKDSPWAITVVSQTQFWTNKAWPRPPAKKKVDPKQPAKPAREADVKQAKTILSVIVSSWETAGDFHGAFARYTTIDQAKDEVWRELKAHFNDTPAFPGGRNQEILTDDALLGWRVNNWDFEERRWFNDDELFVNGVNSWRDRPGVSTDVKNLFLAADYVRTSTDLATMESANEAARLAVNEILFAEQSPERPCEVWPFEPVPPAATVALARALGGVAGDAARRAVHASTAFVGKLAADWMGKRRF